MRTFKNDHKASISCFFKYVNNFHDTSFPHEEETIVWYVRGVGLWEAQGKQVWLLNVWRLQKGFLCL